VPRWKKTLAWLSARGMPGQKPSHNIGVKLVTPFVTVHAHGETPWGSRSYAALAREGFTKNAIVYRAVRMIAEAAASTPVGLFRDGAEIFDHHLLNIIKKPNHFETRHDLLETWFVHLLISGNAYLEATWLNGLPRELYALRPDRMKVVPDADGWPQGYEYTVDGKTVRYEQNAGGTGGAVPRPILHVKLPHPLNDHYGLSPIEAAGQAIGVHNAASRWNKSLLDNSARPSGALVYSSIAGQMTDAQFKRLKSELEDSYQGAINAGRPMLLEGGLDWKALSLTPRDMDFTEAKNAAAREIALALGTPPMLLGIPGDNTYSNYREANRTFWRQTVLPLATRALKAISGWLAPAYGDGVELRPALDRIDALAQDRAALWEQMQKADFLTINEKRAAIGLGPIEGGDRLAPP
jgi:HK97 family phage portal protein